MHFSRIFSLQTKTITSAAILLGVASFVSRAIGILRDRIFAHFFGAGPELDAYFAAFRIPDLLYNLLIVGALSAGFIPIFAKLWSTKKEEAWRITSAMINILGVVLCIFCAILYIFTPSLMPLLVPGFNEQTMQTTATLTRIMLISPLLLGLSGILSGALQSLKAFLVYSLTPIVYNIGIIIGALAFVPLFGISGLAYGVILGAFLHLLIQIPPLLRAGFRYRMLFLWRNEHVKAIGKLMIPRTLGLATTQLNLTTITLFSSTLGVGSVAIFNFASNIQHFPVGIIGISFAIAAFPTLAELFAEKKTDEMKQHFMRTIHLILFFIIPLGILFLLLRAQIVRVVLGSGQFDWTDTIHTANTLAFFTLSFFAQALIPLLVRMFFALHDTWTPFLVGLISALINIIAAMYLKETWLGVSGLALAFSIAMIVQLLLLWLTLRTKIGSFQEIKSLQFIYKIFVAAVVMAVAVQFLKAPLAAAVDMTKFWGIFTQGTISGITGLMIYCIICHLFRVKEMTDIAGMFTKRILKMKPQQAELTETDEV